MTSILVAMLMARFGLRLRVVSIGAYGRIGDVGGPGFSVVFRIFGLGPYYPRRLRKAARHGRQLRRRKEQERHYGYDHDWPRTVEKSSH